MIRSRIRSSASGALLPLVFLLLAAGLLAAKDGRGATAAGLRIGHIKVVTTPLFDAAEQQRGSFYRAANVLHVQTGEALLRRFLLFHEGDPYDPVLLEETERNLRLFGFLKSVAVTASEPHDGVVDVLVATQDAWTTGVNGDFSNEGGTAAYDFDLSQKNLFGTGSELQLHLDHGIERDVAAIEFLHPAVFGAYWNLDAFYAKSSDGGEQRVSLERPLFSYTTPWTAAFLFDHLLQNGRTFHDGEVDARFRQEHRQIALSRSYVLHNDIGSSSRLVGGIDLLDDSFVHLRRRPTDIIPESRHFRFLDGGYESTGFRYMKLDYVDRDALEQDFNLGRRTSLHAALSPPTSSERTVTLRLRATEGFGFEIGKRSFVLTQISATTREPRNRNSILSFDMRGVTRFRTRYPQAFVSRARLDLASGLDRDVQFYADGQNGLRAYPDYAFEGRRRVILNAEYRLFLGRELLQLFAPSLAAFGDTGLATDGPIRFRDRKSDVGIGLRIAIARYDGALIRIDYAYALDASRVNRRGGVLSISTVHAF